MQRRLILSRRIRFFSIPFWIVWGVAIIILDLPHITGLSSILTAPVYMFTSSLLMDVYSLNVSTCCWQSGLVGLQNNIFELGNLFNLLTESRIDIAVFPMPVGNTTNVFLFSAVFAIEAW